MNVAFLPVERKGGGGAIEEDFSEAGSNTVVGGGMRTFVFLYFLVDLCVGTAVLARSNRPLLAAAVVNDLDSGMGSVVVGGGGAIAVVVVGADFALAPVVVLIAVVVVVIVDIVVGTCKGPFLLHQTSPSPPAPLPNPYL